LVLWFFTVPFAARMIGFQPRFYGVLVLWCFGFLLFRLLRARFLVFLGFVVLWCFGFMVFSTFRLLRAN
jgi:hypothetical protein